MKKIILVCCCIFLSWSAEALELAGVNVPDKAEVNKTTLQLNGVGIRTKFFFSVYIGALYLGKKTHDAAAVLADSGAKRVMMVMLMGLSSKRIRDGFDDDLKANDTPKQLAPQVKQFLAIFDTFKEVKKGDVLDLDYIPSEGMRVSLNGKEMGRVAGSEFSRALLKVWLGLEPADSNLEKGMLGE